jgi:hypothetical protein
MTPHGRLLMYTRKRSGIRTDALGTLDVTGAGLEASSPSTIILVGFV